MAGPFDPIPDEEEPERGLFGLPINYNLLALSAMLHPSGGRLVSALAQAQLMKQRKAEMARQKALEGQLGSIYGAPDLEALERVDTKGFRPEAFRAAHTRRGELLSRSAAEAAARAEVEDRPGFGVDVPNMGLIEPEPGVAEQAIPFHPDRAERAGRPPRWMPGQAPTMTRLPGELEAGYPGPVRAPDISVQGRAFPPTIGAPEGPIPEGPAAVASIPIPGMAPESTAISVPPRYRPPRTREELYGALSKRDRARLLEATAFKELPPDLASQQTGVVAPEAVTNIEGMLQHLDALEAQLAPEDATPETRAMFNRARGLGRVAKVNRAALDNFSTAYGQAVTGITKGRASRESMAFRREMWDERKRQFETGLTRLDQMIKNQNFAQAASVVSHLGAMVRDMPKVMEEFMVDPATAKLVPGMRQWYTQMVGRLQFLEEALQGKSNVPLPTPPTGRGPEAPGRPSSYPQAGPVTAPPAQQPIVDYDPKTDSLVPRR